MFQEIDKCDIQERRRFFHSGRTKLLPVVQLSNRTAVRVRRKSNFSTSDRNRTNGDYYVEENEILNPEILHKGAFELPKREEMSIVPGIGDLPNKTIKPVTNCSWTCFGGCKENCSEKCADSCSDKCYNTCRGGCRKYCSDGCDLACSGSCKSCSYGCGKTCSGCCDTGTTNR